MKKIFAVLAISTLFTGCASVLNEPTHAIKLETKKSNGEIVAGADCKLTNDYGTVTAKSGNSAQIHRSDKDLLISCIHPENPEGRARGVSRINGGMYGNVILGGGIGALIDHNSGKAYTYPTWVQVVFGQELVFDRKVETEGQPVAGTTLGVEPR